VAGTPKETATLEIKINEFISKQLSKFSIREKVIFVFQKKN
jgi:hypothetical protein